MLYLSVYSFCLLVLSVFLNQSYKEVIDRYFQRTSFFIFSSFSDLFQCMYFLLLLLFSVFEEREVSENGAKLQLVGPR